MSKHSSALSARVTIPELKAMVARSQRITATTAYDATFARMLDDAGVDVLLVGDSLGMVVQGLDTTLPVTVDEMLYHCRAVARGAKRAHLVGDMPFMSHQVSTSEAIRNAGRFLAEGGMHAVKLEGGIEVADTVRRVVAAGIPVMGHVGLKPQSVHAMGGFRVQGKEDEEARRIIADARAIADAGAYAIVLEGIPQTLAAYITQQLPIATIGIGAGPECDGQILVCYDLLGLTADRVPKFVKTYDNFFERGVEAARRYRAEVQAGEFPTRKHSFGAKAPRKTESPAEAAAFGTDEPVQG